jgi:hypothetical protein
VIRIIDKALPEFKLSVNEGRVGGGHCPAMLLSP